MSKLVDNKLDSIGDHTAIKKLFNLNVPHFYNFAIDVVDEWANNYPDKLALVSLDSKENNLRKFTFLDLSTSSNRTANFFVKLKISKGTRVFVMLPRIPEWYNVLLGCFKLGAVPIPATTLLTSEDIKHRINQSEASVVVTNADNAAKIDKISDFCPSLEKLICIDEYSAKWISFKKGLSKAERIFSNTLKTRSDDPLLIYFTSGTTASPKMVLHTHASYGIGHQITARFWLDLKPTDLHWNFSDTGWAKAAWGSLFAPWIVGASVFLWDVPSKFNPESIIRLINKHRISTFCAPPTVFRILLYECPNLLQKLSCLRLCASGGEPLGANVSQSWYDKTGVHIYEGYGQTETVCVLANNPLTEIRHGSLGKPTPGFEVRVVDDKGNVQKIGKEGEIAIQVAPSRPVGLFEGYLKNSRATESAFKNNFYYTGDRATVDKDGYFWFKGRNDDIIISSSYRISPLEVESVLIKHPAVMEVAVVGKPDFKRGRIVKAFIVLAPKYHRSNMLIYELQDYAKRLTAPYKYPREIEFINSLPRTLTDKVCRARLSS